ncbi:MGDG synthase family glycosyltransferase [Thermoleophilum album]|uniref:MGDG synthase family glycosyltransferase n=1 Tax=Thermoleophilum album TaxID=29539 RepID=UPI0015A530BB|nr:glycosyltransferase [Thermoleophilum album]
MSDRRRQSPAAPQRRTALVLSADVGEGHLASARALVAQAQAWGGPDLVHRDGLRCFGRIAAFVIREGYRVQLRYAPWTFPILYALFMHVPGARALGARLLYLLGRRRLAALIAQERAEVVVSTHPALTAALGEMRRRRRLEVPVCAAITDFADWEIWAHRGVDLHLVCHEVGLRAVERITGPGGARVVRPLVAPELFERVDRSRLRAELELPQERPLVVVSGGGWGVGDLEGAVCAALSLDRAYVVCVCGRNEQLRARLAARFAREERLRVLGYTRRMRDLLRAADVVVHSTGGVTSLEAIACGTPLVTFGADFAHIRIHNRTLSALGLATVCSTRAELADTLARMLTTDARPAAPPLAAADEAPALLAQLTPRVRPLPLWRLAAARAATSVAISAALAAWLLTTDDARWATDRVPALRPTVAVAARSPITPTVVEAPRTALAPLGRLLSAHCGALSVAVDGVPNTADVARLHSEHISLVPTLHARSSLSLLHERRALARAARRLGLRRGFGVLVTGHSVAPVHYLLARSVGGKPFAGAVEIDLTGLRSPRALAHLLNRRTRAARRSHRIVVLKLHDGSPATLAELATALSRLGVEGSLHAPLVASTTAARVGSRASVTTAHTRIASPATRTATPGPCAAERS